MLTLSQAGTLLHAGATVLTYLNTASSSSVGNVSGIASASDDSERPQAVQELEAHCKVTLLDCCPIASLGSLALIGTNAVAHPKLEKGEYYLHPNLGLAAKICKAIDSVKICSFIDQLTARVAQKTFNALRTFGPASRADLLFFDTALNRFFEIYLSPPLASDLKRPDILQTQVICTFLDYVGKGLNVLANLYQHDRAISSQLVGLNKQIDERIDAYGKIFNLSEKAKFVRTHVNIDLLSLSTSTPSEYTKQDSDHLSLSESSSEADLQIHDTIVAKSTSSAAEAAAVEVDESVVAVQLAHADESDNKSNEEESEDEYEMLPSRSTASAAALMPSHPIPLIPPSQKHSPERDLLNEKIMHIWNSHEFVSMLCYLIKIENPKVYARIKSPQALEELKQNDIEDYITLITKNAKAYSKMVKTGIINTYGNLHLLPPEDFETIDH